jgi:hypothetical protein
MLSWVRRQRDKIERIESEADALIHNLGVGAYSAARRREHDANSEAMARHWRRVALPVARKTGRRVGLDASTRIATDASLTTDDNPDASSRLALSDYRSAELMRIVPGAIRLAVPFARPNASDTGDATPKGTKSANSENDPAHCVRPNEGSYVSVLAVR